MFLLKLFSLVLPIIISVNCATFENIKVRLSSEVYIPPFGTSIDVEVPDIFITIQSDNSLGKYVNGKVLKNVFIENQNVLELTENSIDLDGIQQLSIVSNGLKNIQPNSFKIKSQLEFLNLSNNELTQIHDNVFSGLQISILVLDCNKISSIASKAFNNMQTTWISICDNQISKWDSEWFMGTRILMLDFRNNSIQELPENTLVVNHTNYKPSLSLSGNHISEIHSGSFKGEEIDRLDLSNNNITNLKPDTFGKVKRIIWLHLEGNQIEDFNGQIVKDLKSEIINLRNNKLSCVSQDLQYRKNIQNIELLDNPVSCECFQFWRNVDEPKIRFTYDTESNCKT